MKNILLLAIAFLLNACQHGLPNATQTSFAPTGVLRIGVYPGSPTSLIVNEKGERRGVALELGQDFAKHLGLPHEVKEYPRLAEVITAINKGEADFTVTNASPARAQLVAFGETLVSLELGYLLPPQSPIRSVSEADKTGLVIGVTAGSSSEAALKTRLKQATLKPLSNLANAQAELKSGGIQAFATNKGILMQMQDQLPGFVLLRESWGQEHMAIATQLNTKTHNHTVQEFTQKMKASGRVREVAARANLRGLVEETK